MNLLLARLVALVSAPLDYPEMIYIITPMLITLLLMEFYFGRYEDEELGWNTAVGHALVLIFVAVDLLKTIYPNMAPLTLTAKVWYNLSHFSSESGAALSTLITVTIFALGLLLLVTNFFHWLPKQLAFFLSGTLQINLLAYLGIVLVYTNNTGNPLPLDWYTLGAAVLLFFGLWFFFAIIQRLEPKYKGKRRGIKKLAAIAPPPPAEQNTVFIDEGGERGEEPEKPHLLQAPHPLQEQSENPPQ